MCTGYSKMWPVKYSNHLTDTLLVHFLSDKASKTPHAESFLFFFFKIGKRNVNIYFALCFIPIVAKTTHDTGNSQLTLSVTFSKASKHLQRTQTGLR